MPSARHAGIEETKEVKMDFTQDYNEDDFAPLAEWRSLPGVCPTPMVTKPPAKRTITNTDLRESLHRISNPGACTYSAPCVIGAALTKEEMLWIREKNLETESIRGVLLDSSCPFRFESTHIAVYLQDAFDGNYHDGRSNFIQFAEKYLAYSKT